MADRYRYKSIEVAMFIVAWANKYKFGINLTKVQKLLYIAYGAALVFDYETERLCNEHPQAWPYGPVFPSTRNKLLKMGNSLDAITFSCKDVEGFESDNYLVNLIGFVFNGFGRMTASELTAWSHKPYSPWERTVHEPHFKWGNEIPDSYIYEYFYPLIQVADEQSKS